MVRIEKLEMQGFKSFAKKTVLTFPSNFISVAGPNGSGKSNCVDSLCFVLGRSSAKSLRADRMLEVIFNGGKSKEPAEFAKVALHFDNSDKKFLLNEPSVVVSRKINRRGISIYKLNGRTVTREKILEVLRPAHIHPDGHNIILQGDVTDLVEMSPLERREIIDEISGIAEYDEKREKAQRELLTVEERVREGEIILGERAAQLKKLEQESRAAEQYNSLSKDLEKVRASLASKRLKEAQEAMKLLENKINEKEIEGKKLEQELQEAEAALEKSEKGLEDFGKRVFERDKDIVIIREVERLRSEIERKQDRIDFALAEKERLDGMIERLLEADENKAVQEVLKLKKTGVYGTIAVLMTVEKNYQTAIEVAAGPHLHDIVVKDVEVATDCIKFLKEKRIGRATFLPLDRIKAKKAEEKPGESGVIDFAINLIDFDKKYFSAFSFVLGDTLVVDRIETAKRIGVGRHRYATLDGDLVERSGAMIGGFYGMRRSGGDEVKRYENAKKQLEQEVVKLKEEILSLKSQLETLEKKEVEGKEEILQIGKQREETLKSLEESRRKRKEFYEKRTLMQSELNRLNIQRARLEAELENIKLEFENFAKGDIETYDLSADLLEKRMKELVRDVQALGPINMKAIEEFKEQNSVYKEMRERVDKLSEERNRIFSIMIDIESKRKETFANTLSAVTEQFKQVFKDLTNGEADLRLEYPDNIESGLVIEASPEGKKTLNIDSMSGGEKTLTALAFLFAIQRFRPAPFYILDEVDAALDRPNTKKITELIKKYSANSQFIVITHNDTTIQAADCVYGVSMEEGESNLVGIRMPE